MGWTKSHHSSAPKLNSCNSCERIILYLIPIWLQITLFFSLWCKSYHLMVTCRLLISKIPDFKQGVTSKTHTNCKNMLGKYGLPFTSYFSWGWFCFLHFEEFLWWWYSFVTSDCPGAAANESFFRTRVFLKLPARWKNRLCVTLCCFGNEYRNDREVVLPRPLTYCTRLWKYYGGCIYSSDHLTMC